MRKFLFYVWCVGALATILPSPATAKSLWVCALNHSNLPLLKFSIENNILKDETVDEFNKTWGIEAGSPIYSIIENNAVGIIATSGSASHSDGDHLYSRTLLINKATGHFESISLAIELPNLTSPDRLSGQCTFIQSK